MKVNDVVAAILKKEGVEWVSCFPSNALIEAVSEIGIRPIMFRHERGVVMSADGYSRMNTREQFGVAITQGHAGAENALGGIAQAYSDNIPILYLSGGPSMSAYSVKPNFSPAREYGSVSVSAEVIYQPGLVVDVMRRAFHSLRNGRSGPAIVEIPDDVGEMDVPEDTVDSYVSPKRHKFVPQHSDIKEAVTILLSATKPVIWSGKGVLMSQASEELREFAELTEIPVYCTMPGKSGFDQKHPLALGSGSAATSLQARTWIQDSDVLLAIGSSLTKTLYGQPIPDGKVIIQSVETVEDINKEYSVTVGLPGDAKLTLQSLIDEVKSQIGNDGRKGQTDTAAQIKKINEKWLSEWNEILTSDEKPINYYRVIHELENTLDKNNSIVTHDAGAPRDTIMPFYNPTLPNSYIGWGKSTHLGYGIPLMIGAKMARPDKFCLNFMGDGAFGMSGLDIETSVRAGVPITTIVLNNGGMATYPGKTRDTGAYPNALKTFGTTKVSGSYAKIAEGMGAVGITVTEPSDVSKAIKEAQQLNAKGKTVLIDVYVNLEPRRSTF